MSFPYLDQAGFRARSVLRPQLVDDVEAVQAGFVAQRIATRSSLINSRLRKRYSKPSNQGLLPFGQAAPVLVAAGTSPPVVTLTGRPTLGSIQLRLAVTTPGPTSTAVFRWTGDNGTTWTSNVTTAPSVVLGSTGMTAVFPASASFGADNVYSAATPCPEVVLGWLVALVSFDVVNRRGRNPQDPFVETIEAEAKRALDDLKEAADSSAGLFDLPSSEDQPSAIASGGPLWFTEISPFAYSDTQEREGRREDDEGRR